MKTRSSSMKSRPGWSSHQKMIGLFIALLVFTIPVSLFAGAALLSSESDGSLIELNFEAGDYTLADVEINGKRCVAVKLNGASSTPYTQTKGFPALPYFTSSIAIPGTAAMGFEIVSRTVKDVRVNTIVPSKGSLKRSVNPAAIPYTFGDMYDKDEWYPGQTVTLGEPYLLNAVRGLVVTCYPFQYNPKSGILRVTTSIVVRVKRTGTSGSNTLSTRDRIVTPAFDEVYSKHFINFGHIRPLYTYVPDGDKMVVITPASLKSAVQPLVDWKNQKGIATTVYEYPTQTGGDGYTNLTAFLKGKYTGDKITYIILVGDNGDIPAKNAFEGLSDPSYTLLNGSDKYPDVFIGRLCSSKAGDITALVEKTIKYEKSPNPASDWYQKAIGIGSDEDGGTDKKDREWIDQFRAKMMTYGYTTVDQVYDPDASKSDVIKGINEGRSWLNYMGHGDDATMVTSEFGSSDISSLTNAGMPTIMVSIACNNGQYDLDCIGETMTNASDKGALVFCGSFTTQDWTAPQDAMAEMVEELLVKDKCLSAGAIFYNGECKMIEIGKDAAEETFCTWIYFGDPSVMHFTKKLKTLAVTAPKSVGKGNQQVKVTLGEAVIGRVALYDSVGKKLLGSTMLTTAGTSATVSVNVPDNAKSVTLTVTAFNRVPAISMLPVGTTGTSPNDPAGESAVSLKYRQEKSAVFFVVTGPSTMRTELSVFDLLGHRVYRQSGERIGAWRYTGSRGERIARGTYYAQIKLYDRGLETRSEKFLVTVE